MRKSIDYCQGFQSYDHRVTSASIPMKLNLEEYTLSHIDSMFVLEHSISVFGRDRVQIFLDEDTFLPPISPVVGFIIEELHVLQQSLRIVCWMAFEQPL